MIWKIIAISLIVVVVVVAVIGFLAVNILSDPNTFE